MELLKIIKLCMKGTLTQGQMFSSNPVLSKLEHVPYKAHLAQTYTIKNRVVHAEWSTMQSALEPLTSDLSFTRTTWAS